MNTTSRSLVISGVLIGSVLLTGCSTTPDTHDETFSFSGDTLRIINDNTYMPVTVSSTSDADHSGDDADHSGTTPGEVSVAVQVDTAGQKSQTPAWSLEDGVLHLGSPCGGSVLGYCEASYSITVPPGTEVLMDGQPLPVE